jgi:hypothetical protein
MKLVALILTLNEARHLPRCLASLTGVADAAAGQVPDRGGATIRIKYFNDPFRRSEAPP